MSRQPPLGHQFAQFRHVQLAQPRLLYQDGDGVVGTEVVDGEERQPFVGQQRLPVLATADTQHHDVVVRLTGIRVEGVLARVPEEPV